MKHLHKRVGAVDHAKTALVFMRSALLEMENAESELKLSGYYGAARGIHQAGVRVKDWIAKVELEVKG